MRTNIILINLENYSTEKLRELSSLGLSPDVFIEDKEKGFRKLWIDLNTGSVVAFTKRTDRVELTSVYKDTLSEIEEFKIEDTDVEVILDLDTILDKISKYGINSLVKEEKEFLNSLK